MIRHRSGTPHIIFRATTAKLAVGAASDGQGGSDRTPRIGAYGVVVGLINFGQYYTQWQTWA